MEHGEWDYEWITDKEAEKYEDKKILGMQKTHSWYAEITFDMVFMQHSDKYITHQ